MTLSELDWVKEIFIDTKHRPVFLRQLSLLFEGKEHLKRFLNFPSRIIKPNNTFKT